MRLDDSGAYGWKMFACEKWDLPFWLPEGNATILGSLVPSTGRAVQNGRLAKPNPYSLRTGKTTAKAPHRNPISSFPLCQKFVCESCYRHSACEMHQV